MKNKIYTIGRDPACDININDSTDVVSRNHAILKDIGKGRYIIVDQSRNGTYINGMRMSANEEIPVTRKDVVSFAHIQDLDWSMIPESKINWRLILIVAFLVTGVVTAIVICIFNKDTDNVQLNKNVTASMVVDSIDDANTPIVSEPIHDTIYIEVPVQKNRKRAASKSSRSDSIVADSPKHEDSTEQKTKIDDSQTEYPLF